MQANTLGVRRRCLGACVMTDGEFYTSVAERLDPASAVELMNRYFGVLFGPVFEHDGFVADLKGDGMLAVWTEAGPVPELKRRVCAACLAIADCGRRFSHATGPRGLRTRIGACFGPLALATLGTAEHSEYRAVGDTVNISSRLEQLNKELGTQILVCGELAEGVDEYLFRDVGHFRLRGKSKSVSVHELVCLRDDATARQRTLCSEFAIALADYQHGRLRHAAERLRDISERFPGDGPSRYYLERCERAGVERRSPYAVSMQAVQAFS